MKVTGNLILMRLVCVVIFWVFMALRPAHALPPCTGHVTGLCEGADPCMFNYVMSLAHRKGPIAEAAARAAAETVRRGDTVEAARRLSNTRDWILVHRAAKRACGRK